MILYTFLRPMPIFRALHQTLTPIKASQKLGVRHKQFNVRCKPVWFAPYAQLLRSTPNFWEAFFVASKFGARRPGSELGILLLMKSTPGWCQPNSPPRQPKWRHDIEKRQHNSGSDENTVKCRKSSHLATGYDLNYAGIVRYSNCSIWELKFKVKFVKLNFKISNGMLRHSLATLEGEQDFIFFTEPS